MKRKLFIIASILSCFFSANAQVVGSNDLTFNPGIGASSTVLSTDVQPDGKIIIGGGFTSYNGTSVNRLARINSNGTYDNTFNVGTGANITVYKVGVLASGKVFACGQFTTCNGAPARRIVRLNTNGTADNTFTVSTAANAFVYSFAEHGTRILQ